jgi:hypothetical protein
MTTTITNAHLRDITDVRPFSQDDFSDVQCFSELRAVLKKYGFLDRFGVCLLHKHFDVFSDERLVERCDHSARTLEISAVKDVELRGNGRLIETSWSLAPSGFGREVSCETFCWEDDRGKHNRSHRKE